MAIEIDQLFSFLPYEKRGGRVAYFNFKLLKGNWEINCLYKMTDSQTWLNLFTIFKINHLINFYFWLVHMSTLDLRWKIWLDLPHQGCEQRYNIFNRQKKIVIPNSDLWEAHFRVRIELNKTVRILYWLSCQWNFNFMKKKNCCQLYPNVSTKTYSR